MVQLFRKTRGNTLFSTLFFLENYFYLFNYLTYILFYISLYFLTVIDQTIIIVLFISLFGLCFLNSLRFGSQAISFLSLICATYPLLAQCLKKRVSCFKYRNIIYFSYYLVNVLLPLYFSALFIFLQQKWRTARRRECNRCRVMAGETALLALITRLRHSRAAAYASPASRGDPIGSTSSFTEGGVI